MLVPRFRKREHGLAPLSPCGPSLILGIELLLDAFFWLTRPKAGLSARGQRFRIRFPPPASLLRHPPTLGIRGRFAGPTRGRHQRSRYGHGEDKRRPRAPGNHFILSSSQ